MRLKTLFIRFYRSFNFDYLKKHSDFKNLDNRNPWEVLVLEEEEEKWYPYVQIPIDAKVTTVVGANESGKSHLLDAIEKGITGNKIERKDFCRYSEFFAVQEGKMRYPDFGYEWVVSQNDHNDKKCIKQIKQIFRIPEEKDFVCFLIFRVNKDEITIYIPEENNQYDTYKVKPEHSLALSEWLPQPFRINSKIAIPDSVPIIRLIQIGMKSKALNTKIDPQINTIFAKLEREDRIKLTEELDKLFAVQKEKNSKKSTTTQNKSPLNDNNKRDGIITSILQKYLSKDPDQISDSEEERKKRQEEFQLAYNLVCKISKISLDALIELAKEMLGSKEGHTRAIIEQINKGLAENLNFPSWWLQDRDFQLVVSVRDYDLSFAIRDRTGTEYSFSERSSGLTYFLSYYIQYKAYEPNPKVSQILLMDEPDQYLSSQAQQNLLKIFKSFSEPNDRKEPVQVIYVTHSPFLLDKNHPERIRVLEKGVDDEGTRVVNDASKNHYEPLRSAFGELVGESALISNCNLIVENVANKILIAGVSTYLNSLKDISPDETLDLNKFTIISAEASDNIYDFLYLMRGKDIEKPAMIVLMNSNQENNKNLEKLAKIEESILDNKFIIQITELEDKVRIPKELKLVEIENLIPIPLCTQAAKKYFRGFCKLQESELENINENAIKEGIKEGMTIFEAIQCFSPGYITRLGFARSIVDIIQEWQREGCVDNVQDDFVHNFKTLFFILNDKREIAVESLNLSSIKQRVERHIDGFLKDHRTIAKRSDVVRLLKTIKNGLDNSDESNCIKDLIEQIYSNYNLEKDLNKFVDDYKQLIQELRRLPYEGKIKTQISPIPLKDEDFQDQNGIDASSDFSDKSE